MRVGFHAGLLIQDEGRAVAFSESEREGRAASARDHGDGSVSWTLTGTSPQNEEDTIPACHVLVRTMNQRGEAWNPPIARKRVDDIDCEATNAADPTVEPLRIQVVRAIVDPELWRSLAISGQLSKLNVDVGKLAKLMADAVTKKVEGIPSKQRAGLVLALDATRLPALGFDSVVECCQEQYRTALVGAGFRGIWIVGPSELLTRRLD